MLVLPLTAARCKSVQSYPQPVQCRLNTQQAAMAYIVIAVALLDPRCALILRCIAQGCPDRLKVAICNGLLDESARQTPSIQDGSHGWQCDHALIVAAKAAIHLPCCHVAKFRRGAADWLQ